MRTSEARVLQGLSIALAAIVTALAECKYGSRNVLFGRLSGRAM